MAIGRLLLKRSEGQGSNLPYGLPITVDKSPLHSRHRALFPNSRVRQRLAGCIALTVTFGLIAFAIEVRLMLLRY